MCTTHFIGSFFVLALLAFFAMGLMRRAMWRRHAYACGRGSSSSSCDGGWRDHAPRAHHHNRAHDHAPRGSGWLSFIAAKEGLSHAEERALKDAFGALAPTIARARRDMARGMRDVLDGFADDAFDVDTAALMLEKNRDALDAVTKELLGAMARLHGELAPERREALARALARALDRLA